MQADISCTTTARLLLFPLRVYEILKGIQATCCIVISHLQGSRDLLLLPHVGGTNRFLGTLDLSRLSRRHVFCVEQDVDHYHILMSIKAQSNLMGYLKPRLFFTGCPIWSETWVGLTWIWTFHQIAQPPSQFCQSITPSRTGQAMEHTKSMSNQPRSQTRWNTLQS